MNDDDALLSKQSWTLLSSTVHALSNRARHVAFCRSRDLKIQVHLAMPTLRTPNALIVGRLHRSFSIGFFKVLVSGKQKLVADFCALERETEF
jgi:hypothetical protein